MNLRIYNFNNYYNRKVKFLTKDSDEYGNYIFTIEKANFIPNDGITTTHIFGNNVSTYDGTGDYLVVTDEDNEIVSRWFILEAIRLRGGQWQLELRRDLLVDYHDIIKSTPAFIEKAILPEYDPFIFNAENMNFNQIKTAEFLLKDATRCAWIVGYFQKGAKLAAEVASSEYYDIALDIPLENWEYYNYVSDGYINVLNNVKYYNTSYTYNNGYDFYIYETTRNGTNIIAQDRYAAPSKNTRNIMKKLREILEDPDFNSTNLFYYNGAPGPSEVYSKYKSAGFYSLEGKLRDVLGYYSNSDFIALNEYNNKIIRFSSTGGSYKYYNCSISKIKDMSELLYGVTSNTPNSLDTTMAAIWDTNPSSFAYQIRVFGVNYSIKLTEVLQNKITVDFNEGGTKYSTDDAPYDIFCIPYPTTDELEPIIIYNTGGEVPGKTGYSSLQWEINGDASIKIAQALNNKYSGGQNQFIYDMQILPYCPCRNLIVKNYTGKYIIDCNSDLKALVPIFAEDGRTILSSVFFASKASFTFDIPLENTEYNTINIPKINITNKKIENQTDMFRLVSPNYNGQFEFNAAKNGGISYFNVDCTYKPYNPYIHLNPDFNILYGTDFNDARGLICGGEFSLPVMTDAWAEYQRSNKYYQDIFDRQIENLETTRDIERDRLNYSAITNILKSGMSGAVSGAAAGGVGAGAGAAFGMLQSAGAAAVNYSLSERGYTEALDYKQDMFGYQLATIQALPASLTKTTAFTYNNKYYPVLEYYTCTEYEKNAFANKIAYNSMSVGRIDVIENYIYNKWSYGDITSKGYIKATPIHLDNIGEDYHIANEIANELNKGAYYG